MRVQPCMVAPMAVTTSRNIRVDDPLWELAGLYAAAIGTDTSDLIRMLLRFHLLLAGPPPRPANPMPTLDEITARIAARARKQAKTTSTQAARP